MRIEKNRLIFEHLFSSKSFPNDEEQLISIDNNTVKAGGFNKGNAKGNFATFNNVEDLYKACKESAKNYKIFK